jgi:hypothetical protein
MKRFALLAFALFTASARADVRPIHAMNVFRGEYKVVMPVPEEERGHDTLEFKLGSRLQISDVRTSYHTRSQRSLAKMVFSAADEGPNGLPVLSLVFTSGSDEDTSDIHLRLTVEQNVGKKTLPVFLDAIFTFNDGPNESSSVSRMKGVKILKKQADGSYKALSEI